MILAQNGESATELYGDSTSGILSDGDFSGVADALSDSLGRDRDRANDLSHRASTALASLAASGVDVSVALPGLIASLANRPDAVAIPALAAIGASGGQGAAAKAASLSADATRSDEAREAAAMACAAMFTRGVSGDGALDALHGVVTSDAALNVRGAAAAALGRLDLDASMRAELLRLVRVNVGE
jgi:hypothetical protein